MVENYSLQRYVLPNRDEERCLRRNILFLNLYYSACQSLALESQNNWNRY